jgi:hypothetical protein
MGSFGRGVVDPCFGILVAILFVGCLAFDENKGKEISIL